MRTLDITTAGSCPINCYPYCPQRLLHDSYKGEQMLSLDGFERMLSNTPTDVTLNFCGFVECFTNTHALEMMEMGQDEGYEIQLSSTLVGLKPDDIDRLAKIDLQKFVLHLPDPSGAAHIKMDDNYKETLIRAFTKLDMTGFSVMNKHFISHYRAGNCPESPFLHKRGPFYCIGLDEGPNFEMLPDGTALLCCMDFGLKHILGNLFTTPYDDIRKSEEFRRIWKNRLALDGDVLCRSCRLSYGGRQYPAFMIRRAGYAITTKLGVWPTWDDP